jgi:hypothetical protein
MLQTKSPVPMPRFVEMRVLVDLESLPEYSERVSLLDEMKRQLRSLLPPIS